MAVPGLALLVCVLGVRADQAVAALVGIPVRMHQVVRRPHLAKATRAAAVWEMRNTTCEQVVAAAALVRRAQMGRRVKGGMEVMAAHPASQIHPSPMQVGAAVQWQMPPALVDQVDQVAAALVESSQQEVTARTASAAVVAAAPLMVRAETVATAS